MARVLEVSQWDVQTSMGVFPSLAASVDFRSPRRLFGSLPHDMSGPAGGVRADYVRQLIPNDRERSLLIDAVPDADRSAQRIFR